MTLWDMCSFCQRQSLGGEWKTESLGPQTLRQVVTFLICNYIDAYITVLPFVITFKYTIINEHNLNQNEQNQCYWCCSLCTLMSFLFLCILILVCLKNSKNSKI